MHFCLWLAFLSLPPTQSFVTGRPEIVESNLLVTRPVTSACSFSLACSSLSLPLAISLALDPLFPRTPCDYLGALSLTYGASVPVTRISTAACCLYFSFVLATSPFSFSSTYAISFRDWFAFFSFSFALSLFCFIYYADRNYSLSLLSPPSSAMVAIAGSAAAEDSAAEDSAELELIVSFGVQ